MRLNIEAERGRAQMSKTDVCRRIGVSGKTYLGYIRGKPIPSDKLLAMAKLFGVSCDYLLGRINEISPHDSEREGA